MRPVADLTLCRFTHSIAGAKRGSEHLIDLSLREHRELLGHTIIPVEQTAETAGAPAGPEVGVPADGGEGEPAGDDDLEAEPAEQPAGDASETPQEPLSADATVQDGAQVA
jgi:hypothetical protein